MTARREGRPPGARAGCGERRGVADRSGFTRSSSLGLRRCRQPAGASRSKVAPGSCRPIMRPGRSWSSGPCISRKLGGAGCAGRVSRAGDRSARPDATAERFPNVELQREWPDEALAKQPLTARSALIALAHDPKLDDAGPAAALRSPAFYVGALGSVRTHARRLSRLEAQASRRRSFAKSMGRSALRWAPVRPPKSPSPFWPTWCSSDGCSTSLPRITGMCWRPAPPAAWAGTNSSCRSMANRWWRMPWSASAAGLDPVIVVTGLIIHGAQGRWQNTSHLRPRMTILRAASAPPCAPVSARCSPGMRRRGGAARRHARP